MTRTRRYLRLLPLLCTAAAALLSWTGCSDDDSGGILAEMQRDIWDSRDISDYSYRLRQGCFCDPITTRAVVITVAADTIAAVRDIAADTLISRDYWDRFKTIDGLFEVVIHATRVADHCVVEYDPRYGYPVSVDVYWDYHATDSGWEVEAGDLQVPAAAAGGSAPRGAP